MSGCLLHPCLLEQPRPCAGKPSCAAARQGVATTRVRQSASAQWPAVALHPPHGRACRSPARKPAPAPYHSCAAPCCRVRWHVAFELAASARLRPPYTLAPDHRQGRPSTTSDQALLSRWVSFAGAAPDEVAAREYEARLVGHMLKSAVYSAPMNGLVSRGYGIPDELFRVGMHAGPAHVRGRVHAWLDGSGWLYGQVRHETVKGGAKWRRTANGRRGKPCRRLGPARQCSTPSFP